jgi:hypothetical protein
MLRRTPAATARLVQIVCFGSFAIELLMLFAYHDSLTGNVLFVQGPALFYVSCVTPVVLYVAFTVYSYLDCKLAGKSDYAQLVSLADKWHTYRFGAIVGLLLAGVSAFEMATEHDTVAAVMFGRLIFDCAMLAVLSHANFRWVDRLRAAKAPATSEPALS